MKPSNKPLVENSCERTNPVLIAAADHGWIHLALIVMGVAVCFGSVAWINYGSFGLKWQGDDFLAFYFGGKLAGTSLLYNQQAIHDLEAPYHTAGFSLPFMRWPIEAWLFKPLSLLPYGVARAVYLVASLAAAIFVILKSPGNSMRDRLLLGAWFLPIASSVLSGQDTIFFGLLALAAAARLEKGSDVIAGLLLGCCCFKYHLGIGILTVLVSRKLWWTLAGGALSALALFGLSFLLQGPWLAQYFRELSFGDLSPDLMPTVRGFASHLPASMVIESALSLGLVVLTWRVARRTSISEAISLALLVGVLAARHAWLYDLALAFPLLSITWTGGARGLLIPLLLPPIYIIYLTGISVALLTTTGIVLQVSMLGLAATFIVKRLPVSRS